MFKQFLRWFRRTSLFDWHNRQIDLHVKAHAVTCEVLEAALVKNEVLQRRIDEWIARSEGSRYKQLYDELKNKPHYLEAHANRQAKMLNWIGAEMKTMYPNLLDKAREKIRG